MSGNSTDWIEIIVPASSAIADDLAAIITERVSVASAGVQLRSDELVFWATTETTEVALEQTRALLRELASDPEGSIAIDPAQVTARPAVPEEQWRDAWKRYFYAIRLTRQIVVVPSWQEHGDVEGGARPDDVAIALDPGQAFGTGAHATTRLLLDQLQQLRDGGRQVRRFFDCGAGSGILAIAAARLWPESTGLAVDIDPLAVQAAAENAARNRVADRIEASDVSVDQLSEQFELVCANIRATVLTELAAPIAATVAEGGCLLLSGLLHHEAAAVADTYVAHGLRIEIIERSDFDPEWSCVRLVR